MVAFLVIFALMLNLTDSYVSVPVVFLFCVICLYILYPMYFNSMRVIIQMFKSSDIHTVQTFQDLRQQGMKTNNALFPLI